jgi:short-subunit dehydrogenase
MRGEQVMANPDTRPLAVVTGASSGIGYELGYIFSEVGYDLVVAAEDPGITTAATIFSQHGVIAEAVQADLATYDGVEELYAALRGRVPAAVAINAGIGVHGDFARDTDLAADLRLIDLNVRSTVHLAKRVLQDMVPRNAGRLLFTSSIAARMPGPYEATYAASKAFILSFGAAVRYELRDTGITVTVLMPGPTDTNFFDRAGMGDTKLGAMEDKDDPRDVAREGFDAMMAGENQVVAGSRRNKLHAAAGKVLPETVSARMHGQISQPGSAS